MFFSANIVQSETWEENKDVGELATSQVVCSWRERETLPGLCQPSATMQAFLYLELVMTQYKHVHSHLKKSKNMQVNEVMFKLQTFITVLHAKCNTGEKDFKSEQCKHERSQRAEEDK